jgi:hypothetical protein
MRYVIAAAVLLSGCTGEQWAQVGANISPSPKARCDAQYATWELVATSRDADNNPTYTYRCRALD